MPHSRTGFLAGTLIVTIRGEIPAERIAAEDLALTLSGDGAPLKQVTRVGVTAIDLAATQAAAPVRITAGAFEAGMPARDLRVAPGHGIAAEDAKVRRVLIPARSLVNGATILREPATGVARYVDIETESHDILLADGMAAESHPADPHCLPRAGLDAARHVHAALLARAIECGHRLSEDPALTLHRDGRAAPRIASEGGIHVFRLPPGAGPAILRSRRFSPADTDPAGDDRVLGIAVARILHDGCEIDLAGAACATGFLAPEGEPGRRWRWTAGEAAIALPASARESTLELHTHLGWARYWQQ